MQTFMIILAAWIAPAILLFMGLMWVFATSKRPAEEPQVWSGEASENSAGSDAAEQYRLTANEAHDPADAQGEAAPPIEPTLASTARS